MGVGSQASLMALPSTRAIFQPPNVHASTLPSCEERECPRCDSTVRRGVAQSEAVAVHGRASPRVWEGVTPVDVPRSPGQ